MLYLGPKSFDNQAATLEQVLLFTFGVMRDKYFQSKTVFAQKHRSTAKNFSEMGKILLILPHPILHCVQSNTPQAVWTTAYYTGNYTPHTPSKYSIALPC